MTTGDCQDIANPGCRETLLSSMSCCCCSGQKAVTHPHADPVGCSQRRHGLGFLQMLRLAWVACCKASHEQTADCAHMEHSREKGLLLCGMMQVGLLLCHECKNAPKAIKATPLGPQMQDKACRKKHIKIYQPQENARRRTGVQHHSSKEHQPCCQHNM